MKQSDAIKLETQKVADASKAENQASSAVAVSAVKQARECVTFANDTIKNLSADVIRAGASAGIAVVAAKKVQELTAQLNQK